MPAEKKVTKKMIKEMVLDFLEQSSACPDTKKGKFRCGMKHRNALVLATSHNNIPRATAVEFFHEGRILS